MKILRTEDEHFAKITDFPFEPKYLEVPNGLRMHYVEEGIGETILCLHGEPTWSYLYRKFIPILSKEHRVICPDLIGFGKSDKPSKKSDYTFDLHMEVFDSFIQQLKLKDITLVVQDWGGLIGLAMVGIRPDLFKRLIIMNTYLPVGDRPVGKAFSAWVKFARFSPFFPIGKIIQKATCSDLSDEVVAAYNAPFPKAKFKAGARAFPMIVPTKKDSPGVHYMVQARKVLSEWNKACLILFSDKDPIFSRARKFFLELIPNVDKSEDLIIRDANHFLQEDKGEEIANHIVNFIKSNP